MRVDYNGILKPQKQAIMRSKYEYLAAKFTILYKNATILVKILGNVHFKNVKLISKDKY